MENTWKLHSIRKYIYIYVAMKYTSFGEKYNNANGPQGENGSAVDVL